MESIALRECRLPDFADIQVVALPDGATTDPTAWVKLIFTTANTPIWVKALFAARRALAPILGIPNRDLTMFEVDRATTVVKLHGWRGRLYWIPAGFFHASVFKAHVEEWCGQLPPLIQAATLIDDAQRQANHRRRQVPVVRQREQSQ